MSFDGSRHARVFADQAMPTGQRRAFPTVLDGAGRKRDGMSSGVVPHGGVPVLHAINSELPRRSVEIGVDFSDGWRWFAWAESGATIGTVDDADGVADVVGRAVGAQTAGEAAVALEITKAAYQETLARAGMLARKTVEVHTYAESQLVEVAEQDDGGEPGA
ncbi:hypothetical protein [Actinomadura pelletieri]|nr:hypothetical protein [Actinomadura pelletieri]